MAYTATDLFNGHEQVIGVNDEYVGQFWVRECALCGSIVSDEPKHLEFHNDVLEMANHVLNTTNQLRTLVDNVQSLTAMVTDMVALQK